MHSAEMAQEISTVLMSIVHMYFCGVVVVIINNVAIFLVLTMCAFLQWWRIISVLQHLYCWRHYKHYIGISKPSAISYHHPLNPYFDDDDLVRNPHSENTGRMCFSHIQTYMLMYMLLMDGLCVCLQDQSLGMGTWVDCLHNASLRGMPWLNNQSLRAC